MIIQYAYRILRVEPQAKTMEVVYDSPQFGVLHVFTRMPGKGEPLESVIRQYAPIEYWRDQIAEVDDVEVDTYGAIEYNTEPSVEDLAEVVRRARDQLLIASDFTQLPDAPSSIDKVAWQTYRQLLREIPDQPGFPTNVVWPNMPTTV